MFLYLTSSTDCRNPHGIRLFLLGMRGRVERMKNGGRRSEGGRRGSLT